MSHYAFKVCRCSQEGFTSSSCTEPCNLWNIRYLVGRETKPRMKGSKIFCFDSFANARLFKWAMEELGNSFPSMPYISGACWGIFRCVAQNPAPITTISYCDPGLFSTFWNRVNFARLLLTLGISKVISAKAERITTKEPPDPNP